MATATNRSENEFNARMSSLILTLGQAILVQHETRRLSGKSHSKVLDRWYDELSGMWAGYGQIQ